MKNTGAEPGEKCSLCGNDMNPRATVCGHCRATREIVRPAGSFKTFMIAILMVMMIPAIILAVMVLGAGAFTSNGYLSFSGFVIAILPFALIWAILRSGKEVVMYCPPRNLQQEDAFRRAEEERRRRLYD